MVLLWKCGIEKQNARPDELTGRLLGVCDVFNYRLVCPTLEPRNVANGSCCYLLLGRQYLLATNGIALFLLSLGQLRLGLTFRDDFLLVFIGALTHVDY